MKKVETEAFIITLHENGIKEILVKKDIILEPKHVWESRDLSHKELPLPRYYVLLEGEENSSVSHEARRAAATDEYNKDVGALALFSKKTYEAIMGNLFLKINKPKVTTRFFDNRDEAIKWLNDRIKEQK